MRFLDKVNSPEQLKKLTIPCLLLYAEEVRKFLISSVSQTGGHLASNLGVVELTIALHYCFNTPKDKLVFDVGHQAYVHKLITGRLEKFSQLRQLDGMSGFPKTSESEHDSFDVGHSSTSISAALGLCIGRDLNGSDEKVAAIIGDGSLTGGLAYEGLNNAGRANTDILVILNDNEMSISRNVGALSNCLNAIRTAPNYLSAKADIKGFLNGIPIVGEGLGKIVERFKTIVRYSLVSGVFFEELGFRYIGPIDGHNIKELIEVLNKVKKLKGPVLLHVYTKKGKGYSLAENYPEKFHGVEPFNVETGEMKKSSEETYSSAFGKELCRLAEENKKIVAITAAMTGGTGLSGFQAAYPKRLFDVGIAEGHAVTFAAGLAKQGLIPVFAVYSTFLQRGYDQIIHDVCLQGLHVIFAIDRAGIVGADGETHQGTFDLSYLSHIPNLTILSPKNTEELKLMLQFAVSHKGPIAIRYPRGGSENSLHSKPIMLGVAEEIESGKEIAIVSVGAMMDTGLEVYKKLKADGKNPSLINARFIKPIDNGLATRLRDFDYVFVLEDNLANGGYGSLLLKEMAEADCLKNTRLHIFAFPQKFIPQGTRSQLFERNGLSPMAIYEKIKEIVDSQS